MAPNRAVPVGAAGCICLIPARPKCSDVRPQFTGSGQWGFMQGRAAQSGICHAPSSPRESVNQPLRSQRNRVPTTKAVATKAYTGSNFISSPHKRVGAITNDGAYSKANQILNCDVASEVYRSAACIACRSRGGASRRVRLTCITTSPPRPPCSTSCQFSPLFRSNANSPARSATALSKPGVWLPSLVGWR